MYHKGDLLPRQRTYPSSCFPTPIFYHQTYWTMSWGLAAYESRCPAARVSTITTDGHHPPLLNHPCWSRSMTIDSQPAESLTPYIGRRWRERARGSGKQVYKQRPTNSVPMPEGDKKQNRKRNQEVFEPMKTKKVSWTRHTPKLFWARDTQYISIKRFAPATPSTSELFWARVSLRIKLQRAKWSCISRLRVFGLQFDYL